VKLTNPNNIIQTLILYMSQEEDSNLNRHIYYFINQLSLDHGDKIRLYARELQAYLFSVHGVITQFVVAASLVFSQAPAPWDSHDRVAVHISSGIGRTNQRLI
jgi:hypothetical protein